jgi:hypothetical protein
MLCPANILGYFCTIRLAPWARQPSFRAECPAPLVLREAPGHAAEESLFDLTQGNADPRAHSNCFCISANKFNASSGVS